jgi:VTC domain
LRYEYKYIVPNFRLSELRSMLMPFMRLDDEASKYAAGQYTVRSIYFDTPNFEMYHTKQQHLAHRMKVRLRGYTEGHDEAPCFCEIKRKYEGPIIKNRAKVSFGNIKRIFAGEPIDNFLPATMQAENVRRFFYQIYTRHLTPVVNVIYDREPYVSKIFDPDNDARITMDKNLRSVAYPKIENLYNEHAVRHIMTETFILEVKFNRGCPAWMRPILANMELFKAPASKYVLCIDNQPEIQVHRKNQGLFRS